jgi:uncharacterized protein
MMTQYEPVPEGDRLHTLDVLRGAALLGILLMNIQLFGMPHAAYSNLNLWGGRDGANLWTFVVQWIFFEGKMRAMFSMMFGVGIALFLERATRREDSVRAADLFARRMLWLMAFGIIHAWLIWYGDILYAYAICGLLIFPARHLPPRTLFATAAVALTIVMAMFVGDGLNKRSSRQAAAKARAAEARGQALTEEQKEAIAGWDETLKEVAPPREDLQAEVDNYRSGYVGAMKERAEMVLQWHFIPVYFPLLGDFWALMLIGVGLYKLGVLQGDRPLGFYVRMAIAGYAVGIVVNGISTYLTVASNFDPVVFPLANAPHQIGRVSIALAHLAMLVIAVKTQWVSWLTRRVASVGQMALSNYIAHSVICSLVFYSPGLALMGQLERYQLYYVVAAIWVLNLTWSPWWLARYRFGPLEWCWRSLTYWQRQPMRRVVTEASVVSA